MPQTQRWPCRQQRPLSGKAGPETQAGSRRCASMAPIISNTLDLVTHGLDARGRKCLLQQQRQCWPQPRVTCSPATVSLTCSFAPWPPGPSTGLAVAWLLPLPWARFLSDLLQAQGGACLAGGLPYDGHREVTADYKETLVEVQWPRRPE